MGLIPLLSIGVLINIHPISSSLEINGPSGRDTNTCDEIPLLYYTLKSSCINSFLNLYRPMSLLARINIFIL